jgi:hypothetical protein
MSLTIFIHRISRSVGIVQWFRDPKFRIDYACGPLLEVSGDEFRSQGFALVKRHFDEFEKKRVSEEQAQKVFQEGEAKKFFKDRNALSIWQDSSGHLWMGPLAIERYSLSGLADTGQKDHRCLPANFAEADFWRIFDEVLGLAE